MLHSKNKHVIKRSLITGGFVGRLCGLTHHVVSVGALADGSKHSNCRNGLSGQPDALFWHSEAAERNRGAAVFITNPHLLHYGSCIWEQLRVMRKGDIWGWRCYSCSCYNQGTEVLLAQMSSDVLRRNGCWRSRWWNDKSHQWANSVPRPPNDCTNAQMRRSDHIFSRKSQSIPVWGNFPLMAMQTFYRVSGFALVPFRKFIRLSLKHYCTDGQSCSVQSWCLPNLLQLSWSN